MSASAYFFSCDWGTTSLRLRLVESVSGRIVNELESDRGARAVFSALTENSEPEDLESRRHAAFSGVLIQLLQQLSVPESMSASPVVVSGMASSSIGWKELPYSALPFPVDGSGVRHQWLTLAGGAWRNPVLLISGVASASEMMRGEETQIMGLLSAVDHHEFARDGWVVLPGTHSKHVRVRGQAVVGLRTFMTGELFDVLRHHSVLRFTTGTEEQVGFNEPAFRDGVDHVNQHGLIGSLFQVRTRGVLRQLPDSANRSFLSGLLIGAELAELRETDTPFLLAVAGPMADHYAAGAEQLGIASRMTIAQPEALRVAVTEAHRRLLGRFEEAGA